MCMGIPYSEEITKVMLKNMTIGREYIRVYKVVGYSDNNYFPVIFAEYGVFTSGIMKPKKEIWLRGSGFHAFTDYKSAETYIIAGLTEKIIECLAKPEWVIDIGKDGMRNTIRFNKLCFPKFPNTKVTIREFREEIRKDKLCLL